MTKHGIPIDFPGQRKVTKVQTTKILHNDFQKFNKFATMTGFDQGHPVTIIVPKVHPEFEALKKQGYKVIEIWDKRDVREETA